MLAGWSSYSRILCQKNNHHQKKKDQLSIQERAIGVSTALSSERRARLKEKLLAKKQVTPKAVARTITTKVDNFNPVDLATLQDFIEKIGILPSADTTYHSRRLPGWVQLAMFSVLVLMLFTLAENITAAEAVTAKDKNFGRKRGAHENQGKRRINQKFDEEVTPRAKVCEDAKVKMDTKEVKVVCSEKAKEKYQQYPDLLKKDLAAIQHAANNPQIKCKVNSVVGDPKFRFNLRHSTEKDTQSNLAGYFARYEQQSTTLQFLVNIGAVPQPVFDSLFSHEMHHAFRGRQNLLAQRGFNEESKTANTLPYALTTPEMMKALEEANQRGETNRQQLEALQQQGKWDGVLDIAVKQARQNFENMLNEGKANIDKLLSMLENPAKTADLSMSKFSAVSKKSETQTLFEKFKKAAAGYSAADLWRPLEAESTKAMLGHHTNGQTIFHLNEPVKLDLHPKSPPIPLYLSTIVKISLSGEPDEFGGIARTVLDPLKEPLKAALLDVLYFVQMIKMNLRDNDFNNRHIETDAYIYQYLEKYPELFNLLFPKLVKYNLERTDKSYQTCLQRQSL